LPASPTSLNTNSTAGLVYGGQVTATGHIAEKPILFVIIPEKTLTRLKLAKIDPSDALGNFEHRMIFKKTSGFDPI